MPIGYILSIVAFALVMSTNALQFSTQRTSQAAHKAISTAIAVAAVPSGQSAFQSLNQMVSAATGLSAGAYTAPDPVTTPGASFATNYNNSGALISALYSQQYYGSFGFHQSLPSSSQKNLTPVVTSTQMWPSTGQVTLGFPLAAENAPVVVLNTNPQTALATPWTLQTQINP